ncbi:MAG: DUF3883 domain-containing protein [Metamycoplasmataceae bacterium]
MNQNNEIIEIFQESFKRGKAYFKSDNWDKSRCRIDASFYSDIMIDHFLMNNENGNINEYYLTQTRIINNNKRNYKKSNDMDINSLRQLLKFGKKSEAKKDKLKNYTHYDIKVALDDYINITLKNMEKFKYEDILNEWNTYYSSLLINSPDKIKLELKYILNNKELKILDVKELNNKINKYNLISQNNEKAINKDLLENIGLCGEQLVYKNLIEHYGKENVKWVSQMNKYENHDFEITIENKIKYIEVKSTTNSNLNRFYMSRQEYEFYKEYKEDYLLYFVSNIKMFDTNNIYSPNLIILNSPKIEINLNETGFNYDENKILITPNNFICDL